LLSSAQTLKRFDRVSTSRAGCPACGGAAIYAARRRAGRCCTMQWMLPPPNKISRPGKFERAFTSLRADTIIVNGLNRAMAVAMAANENPSQKQKGSSYFF
jgi:ribosomal protein S27AE